MAQGQADPSLTHLHSALSPDRKLLATFNGEAQIQFYDLPTADEVNKAARPKKK